jgi:hypothetical protein
VSDKERIWWYERRKEVEAKNRKSKSSPQSSPATSTKTAVGVVLRK